MTILHVSDFYLPRLGGIEMQVHDLAANTQAAGYKVQVLTETGAQGWVDDLPVTRVPSWRYSVRERREVDSLLAKASVVHCHVSLVSPMAWSVSRRATRLGVPVVTTMHSMSESVPGAGLAFGLVFRRIGDVHWTAVSSVAARVLEPVVGGEVEVLPNGIDPGIWTPDTHHETPGPITLVSVMRLAGRKRALPLVNILRDIRDRVPAEIPLRAVIVGDGPQRRAVESALKKQGLDGWVELVGRLDREKVAHVLGDSHIFLAPATLESFGIAALEARCAGLPVIAMGVGGVREFVRDGREGLLVESDEEMAAAAARLVQDTSLRRQIRAHNCLTPTTLGWEHAVERATNLYRRLGADITPERHVLQGARAPHRQAG